MTHNYIGKYNKYKNKYNNLVNRQLIGGGLSGAPSGMSKEISQSEKKDQIYRQDKEAVERYNSIVNNFTDEFNRVIKEHNIVKIQKTLLKFDKEKEKRGYFNNIDIRANDAKKVGEYKGDIEMGKVAEKKVYKDWDELVMLSYNARGLLTENDCQLKEGGYYTLALDSAYGDDVGLSATCWSRKGMYNRQWSKRDLSDPDTPEGDWYECNIEQRGQQRYSYLAGGDSKFKNWPRPIKHNKGVSNTITNYLKGPKVKKDIYKELIPSIKVLKIDNDHVKIAYLTLIKHPFLGTPSELKKVEIKIPTSELITPKAGETPIINDHCVRRLTKEDRKSIRSTGLRGAYFSLGDTISKLDS
jgi:hypothetical protein